MENHSFDYQSSTGCPEFTSQQNRVQFAAEWVDQNKDMLTRRILEKHAGIGPMDLEDFLADTVMIAHDATIKAQRKGIHWLSIFWTDFGNMLVVAQSNHYVSCDPFDSGSFFTGSLGYDMVCHMDELASRWKREQQEDAAIRSALHLLSDTERRAVELVCGLSEHGHVSSYEAGRLMGISGNNVRVVLSRAIRKVEQAGKLYFNSGDVMLFGVKWKHTKTRGRTRSGGDRRAMPVQQHRA